MADKPKEDKPAAKPDAKPADKVGDNKSEEESINMRLLKQKEKVNEGEQKLKIIQTECNNEIKSFNENRKKIQIQIISNDYEVVNTDMSKCKILDDAGNEAAMWVSGGKVFDAPRNVPLADIRVGDLANQCQKIIPPSNGEDWFYSPMDKFMIDPRNINDKILERKGVRDVVANLMDALPGSTTLKQLKVGGLDGAMTGIKRSFSATTYKENFSRIVSMASNVFGFIVLLSVLIGIGGAVGTFAAFIPLIISVVLSLLVNLAVKDSSTKIKMGKLKGANGRQLLTRKAINRGGRGEDNSAYLELSNRQISSGSTFYGNFIGFINGLLLDNKGISKTLLAANQGLRGREFVESSFEGAGWKKSLVTLCALLLLILCAYFGGAAYVGLLLGFNNIAWPLMKGILSAKQGRNMTPEIGSGKIKKKKVEDIKKSLEDVYLSKNESLEKETVSEIRKLMEIDKAKKENQKEQDKIITKLNAKAKELSRVNAGNFPNFSKYMNYWIQSRTIGGYQAGANNAAYQVILGQAPMNVGNAAALVGGGAAAVAQAPNFSTANTNLGGGAHRFYYGTNVVADPLYSLDARLAQPEFSTEGLGAAEREDYSGVFTLGDYSNLINTIRDDFDNDLAEKAIVLEKIKTRWDITKEQLTQIKNQLNTGGNTSNDIFATLSLAINTLEYTAGRTVLSDNEMNQAANVTAFKKTIELMKKRVTDNEQKLTEYYKNLKEEYKRKEKKSGDKEYAQIPDLVACSDVQSKKTSKNLSSIILKYIKDIGIVGRGRIGNRDFIGIIYKIYEAAADDNMAAGPTKNHTLAAAARYVVALNGGRRGNPPLPYFIPDLYAMCPEIITLARDDVAAFANNDAGSDEVIKTLIQRILEVFHKEDIGDTPILHPTKGGPATGNNRVVTEWAYQVEAYKNPGATALATLNPQGNFVQLTAEAGRHVDCMKTYYRLIHSENRVQELEEIRDTCCSEVDKINRAGAFAPMAVAAVHRPILVALNDAELARDIRDAYFANQGRGPADNLESASLAALVAEEALRNERFAAAGGAGAGPQNYVPAGWENARKLDDVFNFNEDEIYEPYFDLYFRVNSGKRGNPAANKASEQSYNLTTVKHIMGKAKILYLLEKYEKQEKLLVPERETLKELEKMKKELESSGLSVSDRLSRFKKDIKGKSDIVVKILKRNGLGKQIGGIKRVYGITVSAFLNLADNLSMCEEIGKKLNFEKLEVKALEISAKEVKQYLSLIHI